LFNGIVKNYPVNLKFTKMERRKFVRSVGLMTVATYAGRKLFANESYPISIPATQTLPVSEFPALPFAYNALEPNIDARTMEIHYDKHYRAYYTNYVAAVKGTALENRPVNEIFSTISKQPDAIRNNGGGFYNHYIFWNNLSAKSAGPSADLLKSINTVFGSFDKFKETFTNAAKSRFGSGWAWLYLATGNILAIGSTPNQDNPLMDISAIKGIPLLTLDVWEHAYYLKYQNLRADYISAFWNIVNWEEVDIRYKQALG
jgi:superoxide dismutase, Fe-Mn family